MQDTENGSKGLAGLMSWLSDSDRIDALLEAYRAAWDIQDKFRRAEIFVQLFPLYTPEFRHYVLNEVFTAIRLVEEDREQYNLLNKLVAFTPEDEVRRVYREIFRLSPRKSATSDSYEEPLIDQLVVSIQNQSWTDSFGSILRHFVQAMIWRSALKFPKIEPALLPSEKTAETFSEKLLGVGKAETRNRFGFLTRIASLLPETARKPILDEALFIARNME
jgi:hypothetical protein